MRMLRLRTAVIAFPVLPMRLRRTATTNFSCRSRCPLPAAAALLG